MSLPVENESPSRPPDEQSVGPRTTPRQGCPWRPPPRSLTLSGAEVHLWRADLGRAAQALPALRRALPPDELANAGRFRRAADRDRHILARGILRAILARYLATTPDQPVFDHGAHGKPELRGRALHFNLSHSDDLVLCAISRAGRVGVDVEHVRPGPELAAEVAAWLCPPPSRRALGRLHPAARSRAFLRGWTRLEAHAKARGEGLDAALRSFESFLEPVAAGPRRRPTAVGTEGDGCWWLHDLTPRRGYVAALAVPHAQCRMQFWRWRVSELAAWVET
jgi:4'-phosphopantetheinyl transferase